MNWLRAERESEEEYQRVLAELQNAKEMLQRHQKIGAPPNVIRRWEALVETFQLQVQYRQETGIALTNEFVARQQFHHLNDPVDQDDDFQDYSEDE